MMTIPRLLKAAGVLLVVFAGPLVARDVLLRELVPANPCAGTATETMQGSGIWVISSCVGGCGGTTACLARTEGGATWCGCPEVPEWDCCHVRINNQTGKAEKDGDCLSCDLSGTCMLTPGPSKTAMCGTPPDPPQ